MASFNNIAKESDSLIDLLGAQCSDLEKLLALAREETLAAREGKFLKIWDIVSERSAIGKRLETFQHQIAELRGHLESIGENVTQYDITNRVIELSNMTLMQDQTTRKLLTDSRESALKDLQTLERSRAGADAYMKENTKGLVYDFNF